MQQTAKNRSEGAPGAALRVLVAGGQSRAGLALRRGLSRDPRFALTVVVRRPSGLVGSEQVVQVADYFDPPAGLLGDSDVVVNLAGISVAGDGGAFEEVNVAGPLRLAARAAGAGVRRFIQLSSFSVYGYAESIARTTPETPVAAYGASKLRADAALQKMHAGDFRVTCLRVPMLYGGGAGNKILQLAALMMRTGIFPVPRTPVRRSFLHVDNLAVAIRTLALKPVTGVCLAADADEFTMDLLADAIGEVTGRRPHLLRLPDAVFSPLRAMWRSVYSKLYLSSCAHRPDCLVPDAPYPVLLRKGLVDMLSERRATS